MTIIPIFDIRKIIPRWRNSQIALHTGELYSIPSAVPKKVVAEDLFYEKLQLWRELGKIEYAAEVVSAAISLGTEIEATEAAEFLIANSSQTTSTVRKIAEDVIKRANGSWSTEEIKAQIEEIDPIDFRKQIHSLKHSVVDYPRNALKWSDLALYYIKLGQSEHSKEAMTVALLLAPENRFILRSAVRMFIHLDDPDQAHKLLVSKSITRQDPWLLAAEIATAGVAKRFPLLVRPAKEILDSGKFSKFHTTELASALGTLELDSGPTKKAKKFFQASLVEPTENSVAQSIWAKKVFPTLDTDSALNNTPCTFEAQAMEALRELDWGQAIEKSKLWLADELFSSRPAEVGSYAALIGMDDYITAEKLIKIGLVANPNDLTLINNLAFSIACQGRVSEAQIIINNVIHKIGHSTEYVPIIATSGLIHLRSGHFDEGQRLYLEAISMAQKNSNKEQAALASIYFAREMYLAGLLIKGEAINLAEIAAASCPYPHIKWLIEKLKALP